MGVHLDKIRKNEADLREAIPLIPQTKKAKALMSFLDGETARGAARLHGLNVNSITPNLMATMRKALARLKYIRAGFPAHMQMNVRAHRLWWRLHRDEGVPYSPAGFRQIVDRAELKKGLVRIDGALEYNFGVKSLEAMALLSLMPEDEVRQWLYPERIKLAREMAKQHDYDYRVRHNRQGDHVHCRVFSKPRDQVTWANCGTLVVRADELASFEIAFLAAEFMEDE